MSAPLCPTCRHPTRKHDPFGCTAAAGQCECAQTRETLAALDELPAPAPALLVEPEPVVVPPPPEALLNAEPVLHPNRRKRQPDPDERAASHLDYNLGVRWAELNTLLKRVSHREPTDAERIREEHDG